MSAKDYDFPEDCHYTESDEWIRIDGSSARVGITDYAQSELSDIVFVELPEPGAQLAAGQQLGVVESVKAVSHMFSPVSGEVESINVALEENPEWVNEDPYGQGWMVSIAPEDLEAVDGLMSADQYRKYVEERSN